MDTADKFHRVESLKHYKSYGVGKPSTWKTSQSQRSNYTKGPQEVFTLKEYMDEFENICVFILDIDSLNKETIQHYVKRYKDDFGIESIVKKGQKKGQKIEDKNSKIV